MNRTGIFVLSAILGTAPMVRAGTKLSNAALHNDVAKIQTLLASGEKIDEIDKWGWTPLMWAVYYSYAPAAQCLLDHKANPNVQATKGYRSIPKGSTPLIICGYSGLDDFAKMLLKAGADRNIVNEKGKKAIDYAREFGFEEVIKLLTDEKPKIEAPKVQPVSKPHPTPTSQPTPQPLPKLVPTTAQPAPQPTPPPAAQSAAQPTAPPAQKPEAPAKKSKKTPVKKKSEPPAIK
jgi:hypothetical protein